MVKVVMKDEYKFERLQRAALVEVELLKQEFDILVEHTRKQTSDDSDELYVGIDFLSLSQDDIKELFGKRKDRKYASLTVELYAIVEQFLKDVYEDIHSKPFVRSKNKNVIYELEISLGSLLIIKCKKSLMGLTTIRNYIVHNTFSMKRARKNEDVVSKYTNNNKKDMPARSKDLYTDLHNNVVDYINGISFRKS